MADYISTLDLDDILPPVKGAAAVGAFSDHPLATYRKYNKALNTFMQLATSTGVNPILRSGGRQIVKALEDYANSYTVRANNMRKWAKESYDEMYEHSPVMTGTLRDSIRFIGTGYMDIDVNVDPDVIKVETHRYNIVPYYDGRAPGTVRLKKGKFDYSDKVNFTARPKNWWKGGVEPLKGYKDPFWEINIKQRIAEKYHLVNTVNISADLDYDEEYEEY